MADYGFEPATVPHDEEMTEQQPTEADFAKAFPGKELENAKPLLHIEVHSMLRHRKKKQEEWCGELIRLGIAKGQAESYSHWEEHQTPIVAQCCSYTGVSHIGIGQGVHEHAFQDDHVIRWKQLVDQFSNVQLALSSIAADGSKFGMLKEFEAVALCNLLPDDAEEAKTIIPTLERFSDIDLDPLCADIQKTQALR
eukprot:TRINITY_DN5311_c0_g1_i1.p1 TRINITY_DN5311_c0_g1~~TRINITY_DN5311_c0_g1_i1.p1  ORF type:complete len:196 (+),score=46.80 TRINITY_DN5311_c0_g1_i1:49-636(+)